MQIREQGRKIQLLRSVYNPALKKCKQVLVGSISRFGECKLPEGLQAELTLDEVQQFNEWVRKEKEDSIRINNKAAIRNAEHSILTITHAITVADNVNLVKINALKSVIKGLQKVVRKTEKKLRAHAS